MNSKKKKLTIKMTINQNDHQLKPLVKKDIC